ncbi:MAG: hypothetical protein QNJ36_05130 [Calothrix sp. MO_167.B42]|nr:hypothetical protein [Calothrix sp. MO_167.B42]
MLTEDILAREFTRIVREYYPQVGELLKYCHVKVIRGQWGRKAKNHLQYIGIYCSGKMIDDIQAHQHIFREIAENMGLTQVVFLNATRLLRDPMSKLKRSDPRLWLELHLLTA